jgi:hypothetical protein
VNIVSATPGMSELRQIVRDHMAAAFDALVPSVADAMTRGDLKEGDPKRIAESIMAAASWRSLSWSMIFGSEHQLEIPMSTYLETIFGIHLTESGSRKLQAFIKTLPPE